MRKYFEISGYWKDDKTEFDGYIVTNYDDHDEESKFSDDEIFYFGLEQSDIEQAILDGEDTIEEFVITSFEII